LKKLGWVVIKSFLGPFLLNFIIWMLILDMQFLWLYVDDLMGKGLEWYIILELMLYASANWVPVALPLSILMASIMTFGSLGEHNELTAMKSSGLSLFKIMKPLTILVIFISGFAFYFSNNLWPMANFKMRVLISDIQNTKVSLALQPGVFFKSDNFSIRVKEKDKKGDTFKDILIYDHSPMKKQTIGAWSYKKDPRDFKRIIRAKSGKIIHSAKKSKLQLELENGVIIQELNPSKMDKSKLPFMRYYFDSATLHFNLNSFDFERSNEEAYQKEQYLLSLNQIIILNDSVHKEIFLRKENLDSYVKNSFSPFRLKDSISINSTPIINDSSHLFLTNKTDQQRKNEIKKAIRRTDQIINHINIEVQKKKATENYITDMSIEWNRKFTLSYAVLMLFFLGAPLGAIVKKGGLGWPVLIAILFFLLYFILTRSGEEMAENGSLDPITGMWLSAFVVTPITLFIFYKSNQDSRLFDFEFYLKFFNSIFAKKKNK
jgi:lipopolysaccharide export system permease protein